MVTYEKCIGWPCSLQKEHAGYCRGGGGEGGSVSKTRAEYCYCCRVGDEIEEKGKREIRAEGLGKGDTIPLKPFWLKEFSVYTACQLLARTRIVTSQLQWTTALSYC
jgi:hypothetical protein